MTNHRAIVIIGVGNEFRRDDGVGLYVAERARLWQNPSMQVVTGIGDGTSLINAWEKAGLAVVIDCTCSDFPSGTVHRFEIPDDKIPADLFDGYSTHSLSVVDVVAMAGALDKLPERLIVIGIEGADFTAGLGLTEKVEQAARTVVQQIKSELENAAAASRSGRAGTNA